MFQELKVSEELLKAKSKLQKEANIIELDKLWKQFPSDISEEERKEVETQMKECNQSGSLWVLRKTPLLSHHYQIGGVLGNPGQYGVVREAIHKESGKKYAVKEVSKRRFKEPKTIANFFEDLRAETFLMSVASDHPYIIEVNEVFEDVNNLYIVMTHCSGGELFDRIQEDEGFSESKAALLFRQMMSAVYYLHGLGIAHCDLKPENFIFRHKSKTQNDLILIDFGMAKIVRWRQYYKRMNGTPYYIAPEVLNGKYNESCDVWSLGVILFIMIFGFPPFFDENEAKNDRNISDQVIYTKIKQGFKAKVQSGYGSWFPQSHPVSASCRDLISRLLRLSVADRITAEEALEHPWMKEGTILPDDPLQRVANPSVIKSMVNFRRKCGLQQEVLGLLKSCNYLNSSQIAEVKTFFDEADTDKNGLIGVDELKVVLAKVDPDITMEEVQSIMTSIDANNDGFVDFDELLSSRINRKLNSKEERLRKVFKALDLDDSGKINDIELKAALESVSEELNVPIERCYDLIREADRDDDGEIDFEEFISLFQFTDEV